VRGVILSPKKIRAFTALKSEASEKITETRPEGMSVVAV